MATKPLRSVKFPGLPDTYTIPQGGGGTADTYVFSQSVASDSWEIQHNLGKYPSVTVVDSGGNTVVGDVQYLDRNNITIRFASPFSGNAYLN